MRLIDADAMLARLEAWNTSDSTDKALYNFILHRILEQPTVEQPERMRGKWLEREVTHIDDLEAKDIISAWQSCKCSVCGRYDTQPYMYYFNAPKYCGWCGAEMEVSK